MLRGIGAALLFPLIAQAVDMDSQLIRVEHFRAWFSASFLAESLEASIHRAATSAGQLSPGLVSLVLAIDLEEPSPSRDAHASHCTPDLSLIVGDFGLMLSTEPDRYTVALEFRIDNNKEHKMPGRIHTDFRSDFLFITFANQETEKFIQELIYGEQAKIKISIGLREYFAQLSLAGSDKIIRRTFSVCDAFANARQKALDGTDFDEFLRDYLPPD